jgi:hypothetical protein
VRVPGAVAHRLIFRGPPRGVNRVPGGPDGLTGRGLGPRVSAHRRSRS